MDGAESFDDIIDVSEETANKIAAAKEANANVATTSNVVQVDFGALADLLDNSDVVEVSYNNNGQLWVKSLKSGLYREDNGEINNAFIENLASQCCDFVGKSFNMANPFLDVTINDISMSFVHGSVAKNGIAAIFSKTSLDSVKIEEEIENDKYLKSEIREFLLNCLKAHCNIIVCGDLDSGKEELVKYLASKIPNSEKIVTVESESQLKLDSLYKGRDIVSLKTNNIAEYSDILSLAMKQRPRWLIFSEVLNHDSVVAIKNATLSGHHVLSTMYADKAESVPYCLYGMLNTNMNADQFLNTIYRSIQLSIMVKGKFNSNEGKYEHEVVSVCEFYVDKNNQAHSKNIYVKNINGKEEFSEPSEYLKEYLVNHGVRFDSLYNGEETKEETKEESKEAADDSHSKKSSIKTADFSKVDGPKDEQQEEKTEEEKVEESNNVEPENNEPAKPVIPINPLSNIVGSESDSASQNTGPISMIEQNPIPPQGVPGANVMQPPIIGQTSGTPPVLMQGANLMQPSNPIQPQQQAPGSNLMQPPVIGQGVGSPIIQQNDSQAATNAAVASAILPGFTGSTSNQAPPLMGNSQMQQQSLLMQNNTVQQVLPQAAPDSPEAQLLGIASLQTQKQEKPQLMTKPNQAPKKPFAKQKFYSGVVGK